MLYYLSGLSDLWSPMRVFQYITVRAIGAAGTAFLLCLIMGPRVVSWLQALKTGQHVRGEETSARLYELQSAKKGVPTMGGLLIIAAMLISCLLWARPDSLRMWLVVATMLYLGGVGFIDDYSKIRKRHADGLSGRWKLLLQTAWVLIVGVVLLSVPGINTDVRRLMVPFLKEPLIADMGIPLTMLFLFAYFSATS